MDAPNQPGRSLLRGARWLLGMVLLGAVDAHSAEMQGSGLWSALVSGDPELTLRWRYEQIDDERIVNGQLLEDGKASTVRATLGYHTGEFLGFAARLQLEAVGALGIDDYYDGSGSGNAERATIVDPEGVELNEGYLQYRPHPRVTVKGGRQMITYRDPPLHRFMGTVLWRQNWQTHDAATAALKPLDDLTLSYGYIWRVHRIFGDDAPQPLSEFDSDSHVLNLQYTGIANLRLETYAYLLDFDNAVRFSSDTFGIRASGAYPLRDRWSVLYAAEYAHQSDAAGNPFDYDEDYVLLGAGLRHDVGGIVQSVTARFDYELLGGSGALNGAFVTVLGTNHAFQGWADRFLTTPDAGIQDYYVTGMVAFAADVKLLLVYHDLNSDAGSFDYGTEFDVELTKSFGKRYQLGAKAAFYDADPGPRNRSGPPSADASVWWLWGQLAF